MEGSIQEIFHFAVDGFENAVESFFPKRIGEGALDALADTFGKETLDRILEAIDSEVEDFLNRALHMDPGSLESDQCAEALGID